MRKSIRTSISKKTFLCILLLLVTSCTIIYAVVMHYLPKNYQSKLEEQFISDFYGLLDDLEKNGLEGSVEEVLRFAVRNNASVSVEDCEGNQIISENYKESQERESSERVYSSIGEFDYQGEIYYVHALASFSAVSQSYDVLIRLIPLVGIVILIISLLGAFSCSQYFTRPLVRMSLVAKRMADLDMNWKCEVTSKDEIGILATSLNEMSVKLSEALENLQSANEQLQVDMEREREQEQQRIQFFTAVSHDLKTPITIIKGELEGMLYQVGEYKDRDTYLRHSIQTVNNMEKLVKNLLMIAKMSTNEFKVWMNPVNLSEVVNRCCRNVQGLVEDRQMELIMEQDEEVVVQGDERLLMLAISNVMQNAVIYSPEHARINIRLSEREFVVENSGVQISEEDLQHLFAPFYRVEQSRNRNSGGSGLGLSIVKTILDHHGFVYSMNNTKEGVIFRILF